MAISGKLLRVLNLTMAIQEPPFKGRAGQRAVSLSCPGFLAIVNIDPAEQESEGETQA
jgi:hypothetical protein